MVAPEIHVHRFVPRPAGRLYGKPRFRNRCACGEPQRPGLEIGPDCRSCGIPTVVGLVDHEHPLHPCCAEPALMALGARARKAI